MLCFRPINTLVVIQVWNDLFIWILLVYILQTYIKTAAWLSRTLSFCLDTGCRILSSELQLSRCQRGPLYFQAPQQYSKNLPQRHRETQPGVRFKPHEQTEALKPFLSIAAHGGKKMKTLNRKLRGMRCGEFVRSVLADQEMTVILFNCFQSRAQQEVFHSITFHMTSPSKLTKKA